MKTDNRCQVTSMWYCFGRLCVDKCSEPAKEEGTCYDYVLRYSYVSSSGECEPFYYGGCEGNDNRFESTDECEAECMTSTTTTRAPAAITTQRPHHPDQTTRRPDVVTRPDASHHSGWFWSPCFVMFVICVYVQCRCALRELWPHRAANFRVPPFSQQFTALSSN